MPRSDDWTIHMRPSLIKRAAPACVPASLCRERPQPRFASLCDASVNRLKISMSPAVWRDFAAGNVTRIFFGDDDGDTRVAFRPQRPVRQAVEIFVETT